VQRNTTPCRRTPQDTAGHDTANRAQADRAQAGGGVTTASRSAGRTGGGGRQEAKRRPDEGARATARTRTRTRGAVCRAREAERGQDQVAQHRSQHRQQQCRQTTGGEEGKSGDRETGRQGAVSADAKRSVTNASFWHTVGNRSPPSPPRARATVARRPGRCCD
jgi:hypothetical protein